MFDRPSPSTRPRRGRPRQHGPPPEREPSEEILSAAADLFARFGVAGTTMAQIAEAAGLGQSSLYYYVRNKDQLVEQLVDAANLAPLEFATRVEADGGSPAERLWRLIRLDARELCRIPFDINEVHRLAGRADKGFAKYWEDRQKLNDAVESLIAEGVTDGDFRPVDPRLAALTVLANDEGAQNWFRPVDGHRLAGPPDGREQYDPDEVAIFLADLALRGLLANTSALNRVRKAALSHND